MRLLLVEDEKRLADALAYILKKNKYIVDQAYDGEKGLELAQSGIYDLMVLDRALPKVEGLELLKELRKTGFELPVLILTAKDSIEDKVEGFQAGADDYLVKPFATEELLARLQALARRLGKPIQETEIRAAGLVLYPERCTAALGDAEVRLTLKECRLLELLMRHPGMVISKEQIIERIWGYDSDAAANNVEIYIYYLRKKIYPFAENLQILTIRGVGYCLKERGNVRQA